MRTSVFFAKLKVAKYILTRKDSQIMACHYCHSINIKRNSDYEEDDRYYATYKCLSCGAYCLELQRWSKDGEEE